MENEKVERWKNWMDNLSFFDGHPFIIDNIESLWSLTNFIGYSFYEYANEKYTTEFNHTSISLDENINLAQAFFTNHGFDINIRQMIEDKILIFSTEPKKVDSYDGTTRDGTSTYDENHNRVVIVNLEGTIYDSIVIVHEVMHYLNQPLDKRNYISDLLTEAVSYGAELMFCEDLKDSEYDHDRELHFVRLKNATFHCIDKAYSIYKIIYLYKIKGDITEEKYNELYDDNKYSNTMKKFDEYTERRRSLSRTTWLTFGLPLAILLLEEYRKDKNNFKYIHLLNENINDKSFDECLELIDINNIDIFKEKMKNNIESFKTLLDDTYLNLDNHKKR